MNTELKKSKQSRQRMKNKSTRTQSFFNDIEQSGAIECKIASLFKTCVQRFKPGSNASDM